MQPTETAATPYLYVITRGDLSFPQRAVQAAHAAVEAGRKNLIPHQVQHPHLIILEVQHEGKLLSAASTLEAKGLRVARWHEPDLSDELTAIAAEVVFGDTRHLFKRYPLLRCSTPNTSGKAFSAPRKEARYESESETVS